jgi:hypothetical protein
MLAYAADWEMLQQMRDRTTMDGKCIDPDHWASHDVIAAT